jgi:hypothetical protein
MERFTEGQLILSKKARWIGDGCHSPYRITRVHANTWSCTARAVDRVSLEVTSGDWTLSDPRAWREITILDAIVDSLR